MSNNSSANQFKLSLEQLLERIPGMIAVYSVKTGQYIYVNQAIKKILGYNPTDFTEKGFQFVASLVHPEDMPYIAKENEAALKKANAVKTTTSNKEPIVNFEYRMRHKNRQWVWLHTDGSVYSRDEEGHVDLVLNISLDITKRKEVERKLKELTVRAKSEGEERFNLAVRASRIGIWEWNIITNELTWSDELKLLCGLKPSDTITYEKYLSLVHPKDRPRLLKTIQDAMKHGKSFAIEYRIVRPDGNIHWVLGQGKAYLENGKPVRMLGTSLNIDDRRHSKELESANVALRSQHQQLIELNKSKDEFISLASHQLRTPATGVKQYLGMLLEGYSGELTENQMRLLKTAYDSNERQLTIIDDLLRVAHVDAGKVILHRESTDLVELINDIISEQSDTLKSRNQKVNFKHTAKKVFAYIDAPRMRMVLENLIDNASKYSPENKTITVVVSDKTKEVILEVRDQGVGIAKKDVSKLFQKFSRVHNPLSAFVGGTGIGLYWAQKIIDLHHGSIAVKSALHSGTTFTVKFPKNAAS